MLALLCPELDVKPIVTAMNDTTVCAITVAKYLFLAVNRTDIPIGIGINDTFQSSYGWAVDVDLDEHVGQHGGHVYEDGIQAMKGIMMASSDTADIIAIPSATNFPSLLSKYSEVVGRVCFLAMM